MGDLDIYIWQNIISHCDFPTIQRLRQVNKTLNDLTKNINYNTITCQTTHEWHLSKSLVVKYFIDRCKQYVHWTFYENNNALVIENSIEGFLEHFQLLYEFLGHYDELIVNNEKTYEMKRKLLEIIYNTDITPLCFPEYTNDMLFLREGLANKIPCQTYGILFETIGLCFAKYIVGNFKHYDYPETYWLDMKFLRWNGRNAVIRSDWIFG